MTGDPGRVRSGVDAHGGPLRSRPCAPRAAREHFAARKVHLARLWLEGGEKQGNVPFLNETAELEARWSSFHFTVRKGETEAQGEAGLARDPAVNVRFAPGDTWGVTKARKGVNAAPPAGPCAGNPQLARSTGPCTPQGGWKGAALRPCLPQPSFHQLPPGLWGLRPWISRGTPPFPRAGEGSGSSETWGKERLPGRAGHSEVRVTPRCGSPEATRGPKDRAEEQKQRSGGGRAPASVAAGGARSGCAREGSARGGGAWKVRARWYERGRCALEGCSRAGGARGRARRGCAGRWVCPRCGYARDGRAPGRCTREV
ncbi:uncharacterized protein LOC129400876 [Sorex araneus]|uniref:uncharacterized protein LOC129400876 n=1 Tax=Sorex araneus TaxID=42254 RepID=UPI0024334C62|nr:uncharacterized protein LOC129400876 [Sorex araneus]